MQLIEVAFPEFAPRAYPNRDRRRQGNKMGSSKKGERSNKKGERSSPLS